MNAPLKPARVLWGLHQSHGNTPIKLCRYTTRAFCERRKAGWSLQVCEVGEHPTWLASLTRPNYGRTPITDADRAAFANVERPDVSMTEDR